MAADRESSFVLRFDGDSSTLTSVLQSLKSQIKSDVAELERVTGKVELFKGLQQQLDTSRAAFDASKQKVDALAASIDINLGGANKELAAQLAAATKEMNNAGREAARTQAQIDKLGGQLKLAGVDTSKLASEEVRLAAALKTAQTAATNQAAQQLLGLKTLRDVQPEISQLNAAFNTLRVSGTLSAKEIAAAQTQLQAKVAELRNSVTGVASAAKAGGPNLAAFFRDSILPALGITATLATVIAGIKSVTAAAKEFRQGVAEIGTVTDLSKGQLAALGDQARALAVDLGVDVNEALKALFDLIRSGVPPDNAIAVLRVSAEAAKAALTDVGTGAKVANLLLDSFGAQASELPLLFDKIIRGANAGGASFKDFAESAGPLLNVARAAGVSFDEVIGVLSVLVNKSGDVGQSFTNLTKIIARLNTAEVQAKLHAINIEGDSLAGVIQQIADRGLPLADVLGIDLTGSAGKAAASIATLTNNAKLVPEAIANIGTAAGTTKKKLDDLFDSPAERTKRFNAAIEEAKIQLGGAGLAGSKAASGFASLLNTINQVDSALATFAIDGDRVKAGQQLVNAELLVAARRFLGLEPAATAASAGLRGIGAASAETGDQVGRLQIGLDKAEGKLKLFSAELASDIQALNAGLSRDIGDINARADAEIAALDRSRTAQAATAKATLDIQLKAAAERLTAISKNEADVTAAVDKETAARTLIARKQGDSEKKIAADTANARITALQPVLAQYQQHYATLIGLSQTYAEKARSAELARVDIVKSITEEIRQIRLGELDGLDQFVAKQQHIDELISQGRRKAAQGDVEAAKQFFDQAIAESKGLTQVIDENGVVVITNLQAREARLAALKKVADAANESIGAQGAAAAKGANESLKAAETVSLKIKELQAQYDGLKQTVAEGLALKVSLDETSVRNALSTLDEITKPRTVTVTVKTVNDVGVPVAPPSDGGNTGDNTSGGFNRGGLVRRFARGGAVPPFLRGRRAPPLPRPFAFGGPVFNGPKVPGIGDRDTYLTRLQAGSYVIRKRASDHYGDALMRKVARFADGGSVDALVASALQPLVASAFTQGFQIKSTPPLPPAFAALRRYLDSIKASTPTTPPTSASGETAQNVIAYARAVLDLYRSAQGQFLVKQVRPAMLAEIDYVSQHPTDQNAINVLLKDATSLGINRQLIGLVGRTSSLDFGQPPHPYTFDDFLKGVAPFARGGPASDTVPALLTPGEFVVRKPVVRKLGADFFARLNSMQIPRLDLAAMLAPPARIARFADGGYVGSAPASTGGGAKSSGSLTVNINASAGDLLSAANVRRFIVPVIEDEMRKSKSRG